MENKIKRKFSFLIFLEDTLKNLDNISELDEQIRDPNLFQCIEEIFKTSDSNNWLNEDQNCTANVKEEFEGIFNKYFENNDK